MRGRLQTVRGRLQTRRRRTLVPRTLVRPRQGPLAVRPRQGPQVFPASVMQVHA